MNVFSLLARSADRHRALGAVFHGTPQFASFDELRARALGLAGALRQICAPADRLAIFSENCPEYVGLLFGIWAAGCAAVPLNYKLHPLEVRDILEDAEPRQVMASHSLADALPTAAFAGDLVVTAEALDALCLARIARFKRPKTYVFVDSLPGNAYGKVLKRELVARF